MATWEFVEARTFAKRVGDFLDAADRAALQEELSQNPHKGTPIPGCGGLRKLHIADQRRGKGKRGGARILYLALPETGRIYLLDIYGKNERDDLSSEGKRFFRQVVRELKSGNKRSKEP